MNKECSISVGWSHKREIGSHHAPLTLPIRHSKYISDLLFYRIQREIYNRCYLRGKYNIIK